MTDTKLPMFVIAHKNYEAFRERLDNSHSFTAWRVPCEIDKDNWVLKQRIRKACTLTDEQLGFYHAHVRVWKQCAQMNQPVFVVEDCANLTPDVMKMIYAFWERVKETGRKYDLIYIGHKSTTPGQYITDFMAEANITILHGRQELFAYILSPSGAQTLLGNASPYEFPIEAFIQTQNLETYAMYPSPLGVVGGETRAIRIPPPVRVIGMRYAREGRKQEIIDRNQIMLSRNETLLNQAKMRKKLNQTQNQTLNQTRNNAYPSMTQAKSGVGSRNRATLPLNKLRPVTTSK